MGDGKASSSTKAGDSSTRSAQSQPTDREQMSQRSKSDPGTAAMTRHNSASYAVSSSTKERRPSKESIESNAVDDDYNNEEAYEDEEEEKKPRITKRHSSSNHTNVYTECGRHGDDWLFGGISDVVKSVFGKNEK